MMDSFLRKTSLFRRSRAWSLKQDICGHSNLYAYLFLEKLDETAT